MICDLQRLIDDQVPRVRAMPVRRPQKTGMGNYNRLLASSRSFRYRVIRCAILSSMARLLMMVLMLPLSAGNWCGCIHIGLLAQRDSWLDEGGLHVAWNAIAGECGRSASFARTCWPGTRPKMWH